MTRLESRLEFGSFGRWMPPSADFLGFSGNAGRVLPFQGARKPEGIREQGRCRPKTPKLESRRLSKGALFAALTILHISPATAAAAPTGADGQALRNAIVAIQELRLEDADEPVLDLANRYPADPDVQHTLAILKFNRGQYGDAARAIEVALSGSGARNREARRELQTLILATERATAGFATVRSADGRFEVLHEVGRDGVMAPYALDVLRAADRVLSEEFGVHLRGPIRLEIYPSPASLAQVSSLTVEEIERTGTIALCKWDRLMITSPRALVRGYPWADTVAHEFVHLVLSRASRDLAPVWFQEGLAKFLERRWRGEEPRAHLDPPVEALLAKAVSEQKLIPFDQLHPSIARLPSQEDAALAFAQVATFIESFYDRHGAQGLRSVVERIGLGLDARDALSEFAGEPFSILQARWREALARRPTPSNALRMIAMRFRHGEGQVDESMEVEVARARRHFRLGDLLWARNRPGAAAVEYGFAQDAAPDDPIVASRFGRAALASDRASDALAGLRHVGQLYPEHAPLQAVLGAALAQTGRNQEARATLIEAIRLNPFDPMPHCHLARVGSDAHREREQQACHTLGGTLP